MMKQKDRFEADITGLDFHGMGICRHQRATFFVPNSAPGDRAIMSIITRRGAFGTAEIRTLLRASEQRVEPQCRSYEKGCGGCQWLHLSYEAQLHWKTRLLRDTIKRKAGISPTIPAVLGMDKPERYRNKLSLLRDARGQWGFMKLFSREVIPFFDCRQELEINERAARMILKARMIPLSINQIHLRATTDDHVGIHVFGRESSPKIEGFAREIMGRMNNIRGIDLVTYHGTSPVAGERTIVQTLDGWTYHIPHSAFFQNNYEQARRLRAIVEDFAGVKDGDRIADLYCGVGFFSIALSRNAAHVLGIDNSPAAIETAATNALVNRRSNCEFKTADIGAALSEYRPGQFSTIVLDPPRAGCSPDVISNIIRLNPAKIVYVSCSADTFSRDIKRLIDVGYAPVACQPVDLFPHTHHTELVMSFERSRKKVFLPSTAPSRKKEEKKQKRRSTPEGKLWSEKRKKQSQQQKKFIPAAAKKRHE